MNKLEDSITEDEERIAEIDDDLCLESVYSDFDKSRILLEEKEQLTQTVEGYYAEWETLSESLES